MDKTQRIVDVGAPEDGKNTSQIVQESAVDIEVSETIVTGDSVCWFNDKEFDHGDMVYSGNDVLRCDSGVWVRSGRRIG